jgi:hypothetical protein
VALDYDLDLVTNLDSNEALTLFADKLDFEWCDDNRLIGIGVIVTSFSTSNLSELSQSMFEELYGFTSNICVSFRLDKFADYNRGYQLMMEAVTLLLSQDEGDGVLVFNSEITILQRIGGELVVDSKWNSSISNELRLPHQMLPLASPLLCSLIITGKQLGRIQIL